MKQQPLHQHQQPRPQQYHAQHQQQGQLVYFSLKRLNDINYSIFLFLVPGQMENIVCTFDDYVLSNSIDICGGLDFIEDNGSKLAGLELDVLPSLKSTFITDFTSIGKNKYL